MLLGKALLDALNADAGAKLCAENRCSSRSRSYRAEAGSTKQRDRRSKSGDHLYGIVALLEVIIVDQCT